MTRGFLILSLLLVSSPAAAQRPAPAPLEPVRRLYLAAVEDASGIRPALAEVERLLGDGVPETPHARAALTAYAGAISLLRAKHGSWPPARLRHLREGLAVLDSVVAAHPEHAEARYLRLMSCYYLPGILGRNWSVREDFAALARLLPEVRAQYPDELHRAITRFVLEHGRLAAEQRRRLEAALAARD